MIDWFATSDEPAHPVSYSAAAMMGACIITAVIVGLLAFYAGRGYQERKDACTVSQSVNFLGLNSANVAQYCS